ncbi:MAG: hypothetical protein KDC87_20710 [Planctomycetes bacterium]|nr:hypothetical protein [Planctomycetota bacterium]MCB9868367.1 hypothetical protein [Planctomycetota bacterium]
MTGSPTTAPPLCRGSGPVQLTLFLVLLLAGADGPAVAALPGMAAAIVESRVAPLPRHATAAVSRPGPRVGVRPHGGRSATVDAVRRRLVGRGELPMPRAPDRC